MPLVYHVLSGKNVGGAERVVLSLTKGEGRLSPHVLLPAGSALIPLLEKEKIPFSEYKEAKASFSLFLFFYRYFKCSPCDALVSHGTPIARLAGKMAGIPCLVSVKHCAVPWRGSRTLYRFLTDFTVAVSENANKCLQKMGIPPEKRCVIANGFRAMGAPTVWERWQARRSLGIPTHTLAIGIAGRLDPIKGQATAIRALSHLPPRFSLYLLGEGTEKESLTRLASLLGVSERVHFLGFKEDVRAFFHAQDAHLSCSLGSETASLALAEGMSAGCPTFASRIEGNLSRVGEGGVFFARGDESALAKALLSLRSSTVRRKMRRAALARARELPSEEEAREKFEALLLSLLQK